MENSPTQISIHEVTRLSRAATLLQQAARYNAMDEEASRELVRNIYFVDPAMVIWCCRPAESQNLSGFDDNEAEGGHQRVLTTSLLTLDFLFSDAKPGAAGLPVFLSPSHAEELHNKIDKELIKGALGPTSDTDSPETQSHERLAAAIQKLRGIQAADDLGSIEAIDEMFASVNAILAEPLTGDTFARDRFIDLIERSLITQISNFYDILPDNRLAEAFAHPNLLRQTKWRGWLGAHRTTSLSDNLERDAETLAILEQLNIESEGSDSPQRFLLITSSAAIHAAMKAWEEDPEGNEGISRITFARHPRQYIPLFNLNSAPGKTRLESDIFYSLKNAISDLEMFANGFPGVISETNEGDPSLPRREETSATFATLSDRALELRKSWDSAMKTAALLNIDALSRTSQKALNAAVAFVERGLSDEEINSTLADQIRLQTEKMLRVNRAFAIRGRLLASARLRATGSGPQTASRAPRLPILFDIPVSEAVRQFARVRGHNVASVSSLLEWLLNAPDEENIRTLSDFEELLQRLADSEAYSLAAAVVFRARDWAATRHFAQSCIRSVQRGAEKDTYVLREMQYCLRVSERFRLRSFPEFQDLRHRWQRSLDTYRDDMFVRARALSEMAALDLVCAFSAQYMCVLRLDKEYVRDLLLDAKRRIRLGMSIVDRVQGPDVFTRNWIGLQEQLTTNLASAIVLRHFLLGDKAADDYMAEARDSLEELGRMRARVEAHDISRLYEEALTLMVSSGHDASKVAKQNILRIIDAAHASASLTGAPVDEALLKWFASLAN